MPIFPWHHLDYTLQPIQHISMVNTHRYLLACLLHRYLIQFWHHKISVSSTNSSPCSFLTAFKAISKISVSTLPVNLGELLTSKVQRTTIIRVFNLHSYLPQTSPLTATVPSIAPCIHAQRRLRGRDNFETLLSDQHRLTNQPLSQLYNAFRCI